MLGLSFSLLRCNRSENQASTDRTPSKWKPLQQRTFSHACPACPFAQRLDTVWEVFGTSFSGQSCWWNLSWKIRANSSALLVSLPANEAMHVPWARVWKLWQVLGAQFFGAIVLMKFVLKNPCQQQCIFSVAPCQRSYACPIAQRLQTTWKVLGAQFFGTIALMEFVLKTRANSSASRWSLPPNGALPKLFPTVSLPSTLRIAPSHRSSPHAIPTVSLPSTLPSFPYRSFPPEPSASYFPRFPFRPPCRHSRLAPSHRSSPQAISHGFPSVRPVFIPVSLLPTGALPKLLIHPFPRFFFRPPCHHSRLAPSQAISHGFPSVHPVVIPASLLPTGALPKLFPRFPFRPPCRHSRIVPSHRSSPQAISQGFPSVHPVVILSHRSSPQAISHSFPSVHPVIIPASLLPTGALPKLFPTVSLPSTLSSLPYSSFPPELSPSYFPGFPFRPPCRHSFPPELFPSYFPWRLFRPPCRHSRLAPSHRSSPHGISYASSFLYRSFPPELSPSLPSTLSSLPYRSFPPELSPQAIIPRFPFRPPCRHSRIAPSHRSSPEAISHGVPSVHPVATPVSLLPLGALPRLFPTVSSPSTLSSLHLDPSPLNSPHAISYGFPSGHPIVASIRSLPTELSPSYFPRFLFRPPSRQIRIAPSRQVQLNENPSIGDAFGKKTWKSTHSNHLKWTATCSF